MLGNTTKSLRILFKPFLLGFHPLLAEYIKNNKIINFENTFLNLNKKFKP